MHKYSFASPNSISRSRSEHIYIYNIYVYDDSAVIRATDMVVAIIYARRIRMLDERE